MYKIVVYKCLFKFVACNLWQWPETDVLNILKEQNISESHNKFNKIDAIEHWEAVRCIYNSLSNKQRYNARSFVQQEKQARSKTLVTTHKAHTLVLGQCYIKGHPISKVLQRNPGKNIYFFKLRTVSQKNILSSLFIGQSWTHTDKRKKP